VSIALRILEAYAKRGAGFVEGPADARLSASWGVSHGSIGSERVERNRWGHAEDQLLDQPAGQRSKEDAVAMMACGKDQAFDPWMSPEQRQFVWGMGAQARPGPKQGGRADGGHKL